METFKIVHNRKNTRSVKWDLVKELFSSEDVLPMWVADMDFQAPEAVNQALMERAKHGIYGYTVIDSDVKDAIVNWNERRHNWKIKSDWLSFSPGVVTTLHMAIQALTEPEDSILIQTPVYTPFYKVIEAHNRKVIKNPLILEDNKYKIDFVDFEDKLKTGIKAFILCSPHNPVGRVWTKDELEEMARLCEKHDVLIFSDEIHGDLSFPNQHHIPIASISEEIAQRTVTFMAPSKTFNLAGLQASYAVTSNKELRDKLDKQLLNQGFHGLNIMGNTAIEAAYNYGEEWLDGLRAIIESNYYFVKEQLEKHSDLKVIQAEGTYLAWIDCSSLGLDSDGLKTFFSKEAKVGLNAGIDYGVEGKYFMRMNIACPHETLEEGVNRIIEAIHNR
ncbi:MalY/PatB family protein [Ornithinibacillus halotolerans]|uniref:cysteine-S-conjugate beta-lyase n=1 Tax=Ornithinibacillus halotolerans TaxID=1274357 RepID=A0A916W7Z3_9BACI|nr:MalY/PatB family protein [Ornithinibacillus halotolerans]GGA76564.1 cystathionine beta-lyase PatB [Ornithinibacillus halotolerans]